MILSFVSRRKLAKTDVRNCTRRALAKLQYSLSTVQRQARKMSFGRTGLRRCSGSANPGLAAEVTDRPREVSDFVALIEAEERRLERAA
jgi:hypothetical protein